MGLSRNIDKSAHPQMERDTKARMPFMNDEGGFTTPAVALAILLACALVFACTRGITIGSRSGQIQYVADAGALAADNVVAEFVTISQVVDAVSLSLSLLGLTVYAVSAVAAFIPGAQGVATEVANIGSKVLKARDKFVESAVKGLNAAQKALPAICAIRASQVVKANADASGIAYVGFAITSPVESVDVNIPDDAGVDAAAEKIEEKEAEIQQAANEQKEAQEKEDDAKRRAWLSDCGADGMSMYERAGKLSTISGASNPYYSSPDNWRFAIALERAKAYYQARYSAEPGASASGSPEAVAESVARKQFYAYAKAEVAKGWIDTSATGAEMPHLIQLARNTAQIKETWLYTANSYPVSSNGDKKYLHAYSGCPTCTEGERSGTTSVAAIDSGTVQKCPTCNFSATTLGRVPSASTSISNGFEYHYLAVVEASREYARAVEEGEAAKQKLKEQEGSIRETLREAVESLKAMRYDPQPPGRYGCICVVFAPSAEASSIPFVDDEALVPARMAISGATLAPDEASDQSTVISGVAKGLIPQESLVSGPVKTVFGAWSGMLSAYTNGTEGIKSAFRKVLGTIPVVGTTLSDSAVSAFEGALSAAGLEPADLDTYEPVLTNTSHILDRDDGQAATVIGRMKDLAQIYGAVSVGDIDALVSGIEETPEIQELLDENGLTIATIPLSSFGLGEDKNICLPVPNDLNARLEELKGTMSGAFG